MILLLLRRDRGIWFCSFSLREKLVRRSFQLSMHVLLFRTLKPARKHERLGWVVSLQVPASCLLPGSSIYTRNLHVSGVVWTKIERVSAYDAAHPRIINIAVAQPKHPLVFSGGVHGKLGVLTAHWPA
jgi:hypothetical protein